MIMILVGVFVCGEKKKNIGEAVELSRNVRRADGRVRERFISQTNWVMVHGSFVHV